MFAWNYYDFKGIPTFKCCFRHKLNEKRTKIILITKVRFQFSATRMYRIKECFGLHGTSYV